MIYLYGIVAFVSFCFCGSDSSDFTEMVIFNIICVSIFIVSMLLIKKELSAREDKSL